MSNSQQLSVQNDATSVVTEIAQDLASSLPPNIPFEKFKSVFITAAINNPEILRCNVNSIKTALLKCAQDNLVPDGREAVILPYNNTVKRNGKPEKVLTAQYTPMIQGIRKRAKELGGIHELITECVHELDHFDYGLGDNPYIDHKTPGLNKDRGPIIGAYAIFKDEDARIVHRDVMSRLEIEKARQVSRNRDGDLWTKWESEACKKTVVRRGSKGVPSIPDALRDIVTRDDEHVDFTLLPSTPKSKTNPLLEHQQQQEDTAGQTSRHGPDEASGSDEAGDLAGSGSQSPALKHRTLMEDFSSALTRLKGNNLDKGRKNFWTEHTPSSKPAPVETKLEEDIFKAHQLRADGKMSPTDLVAHVGELIAGVYECTSS